MAGAATTTSSLSGLMKTFYDRMLLERLVPQFRYDQFATKKNLPRNEGKIILWNRLTNLGSGYPLTELDVPGISAMSASQVSATLNQLGNLLGISDLFNMTSISKPVTDAIELLSDSAALAIDSFYKEEIGFGSAASTGVVAAASVTYPSARTMGFPLLSNSVINAASWTKVPLALNEFSTAICIDRLRTAVTHLRNMNARPFDDGYYVGIIHPTMADKLMQDTNWASWNQYTNPNAMYKGEIGKVMGIRFVDSTNAMTTPVKASAWSAPAFSAGGTLYGTLVFGKGAYAGVNMEAGNGVNTYIVPNDKADKADPLAQYGTVGYKITIAARVLNASCGIIVGDYITA